MAVVLGALRERGRTLLLASHDLAFVASVADRVIVLGREEAMPGRVLARGAAALVLRDDPVLQGAGLPTPDFIRLERVLGAAGLLAALPVRDEASLLDALARGVSVSTPTA